MYECLNHDQVVSPIHFSKDLPKLHSIGEAAYNRLDKLLEEKGPLNPYEFALLNPHEEFPVKDPVLEDFYDMGASGRNAPNIQHMEDWSILSTEIHYAHQKSSGSNNLLIMEGEEKILEEWATSGKAPTITETDLPDSQLMEEYLDKFDSMTQSHFMITEMCLPHILEEVKPQEMINSTHNCPFPSHQIAILMEK